MKSLLACSLNFSDSVWPITVWGYSVQKTLRKCATNMGSKISLLVYEWLLLKCKIWYMNGFIFQKFPKFGPTLDWLVYDWITFSWKIGICMGLLSNSAAAHPYQNQTWVPPSDYCIILWMLPKWNKTLFFFFFDCTLEMILQVLRKEISFFNGVLSFTFLILDFISIYLIH